MEGGESYFYYVTVGRALHDRSKARLPLSQNFNRSRVLKAIREFFQACYKSITIHEGKKEKRLVRFCWKYELIAADTHSALNFRGKND